MVQFSSKINCRVFLAIVFASSLFTSNGLGAERGLPADAHIRLLTPLSSVPPKQAFDSTFRAVVIAPLRREGRVLLPQGTIVSGVIEKRKPVGLGLLHERAAMSLHFMDYTLPGGQRFDLDAKLKLVENGREYVTPAGEMKGIVAADSPQAVIGGIWTRPSRVLFERAIFGMTGASGRIWKSYALGPAGAAGLFALRCSIFRMPEPDIQLPIGTELTITVLGIPEDAPDFDIPEAMPVPIEIEELLRKQSYAVTKADGRPVKDIINIAFEGTSTELINAFYAAGWNLADPVNAKSLSESYTAFTTQRGYSNAPASPLIYLGERPNLVFQKSLNNIAMRHHIRIWKMMFEGRELWLGAATHDIGMAFDMHSVKFSHRIQGRIDRERSKVVNDLSFSGCAEPARFVDRPAAARALDANGIGTDGRVAFVQMLNCDSVPEPSGMDRPRPVGPVMTRIARRVVLETRNYIERENTFYWAYRVVKWTRAARNPRPDIVEDN